MRNKKKKIEEEEGEAWEVMQKRRKDRDETLGYYIIEIPLTNRTKKLNVY